MQKKAEKMRVAFFLFSPSFSPFMRCSGRNNFPGGKKEGETELDFAVRPKISPSDRNHPSQAVLSSSFEAPGSVHGREKEERAGRSESVAVMISDHSPPKRDRQEKLARSELTSLALRM